MWKITLALNTLTAVLFTAFFTYTFFAASHLRSLARDFVTRKTLHYSGPVIDAVEKSLDGSVVTKLVSDKDLQLVRAEIAAYRQNPAGYIADLTGQSLAMVPTQRLGAFAKKVNEAKQKIRSYYDKSLAALIVDLRIFSGTNAVAAILALAMTIKSRPPIRNRVLVFSSLLLIAIVFCSDLYIDNLSFFRILTATYIGWWYPVLVLTVAIWLYIDAGTAIETVT